MSSKETVDDISLVLYLTPLIVSTAYAFLSVGIPLPLTSSIYLTVTKSSEVFLIGLAGVLAGLLLEVLTAPKAERTQRLANGSARLQWVAIACFVLAVLSAWSTQGVLPNISSLLTVFIDGRYALAFPLLVLVLSLLINPSVRLGAVGRTLLIDEGPAILAIIAPIVMFLLWRVSASLPLAFASAIITIAISTAIYLRRKQ
ncbi:MAG: hypothetical protein HYU39_08160 [Thaumarchaeota archaeon]|nr:hypothetical protein [Nitrososphaerota archaeon]